MIAAHLDNWLFLLLIAVAVLFQLLAKAAGKSGKDQKNQTPTAPTSRPILRAPPESDEDRIRKLLEALGQPPTSRPPPPVMPRTDIQPRPLAPVKPPMSPLSQLRREKPRRRETIPKEIPAPQPVITPEKTVSPAFEVHSGPLPTAPSQASKAPAEVYAQETQITKAEEPGTGITMLLTSTSGLRDAMILREILGPPRGLRMLELL